MSPVHALVRRLLGPALLLVDRLRTLTRLALVAMFLLVPALIATHSYTATVDGQIAFSDRERTGLRVVVPALLALADTVDPAGPAVDLTALEAAVADSPELDLAAEMDALRAAAADGTGGRHATADALVDLVTAAGNESNLILDPDLDSFYTMDALVISIPLALRTSLDLASPVTDGTGDRTRAVQLGTLARSVETLRADLDTVTAETDQDVTGLIAPLGTAADELERLVGDGVPGGEGSPATGPAVTALREAVTPAAEALGLMLDDRIHDLNFQRLPQLLVTGLGLAAGLYVSLAVAWRTRQDVAALVRSMERVALGARDPDPDLPARDDEFSEVARALERTREYLAAAETRLREQNALREEETRRTFLARQEADKAIRKQAKDMVEQTSEQLLQELTIVVDRVAEMRAAADAIDTNVSEADRVTADVVSRARATDEVVAVLGESLRRVDGMAQLIAKVAGQSKMLALNATIEARRAGEAGMGFGVVAGEVKELAGATAHSTDRISTTVTDLQRDTEAVATAIGLMGEGIRGVDQSATALRRVADEQREVVEALDEVVRGAIERIRSMARMHDNLERRRHERIDVFELALLTHAGITREGRVVDLSRGGMRMILQPGDGPVPLGSMVTIDMSLAGTSVDLNAVVIRCDTSTTGGTWTLGLRFGELPPATVEAIERHLAGLSGS